MDWLLTFLLDWCWVIAALPVVAVIGLVVILFVGSKGPYPKINVHKEEKTFIDSKSGNDRKNNNTWVLISGLVWLPRPLLDLGLRRYLGMSKYG